MKTKVKANYQRGWCCVILLRNCNNREKNELRSFNVEKKYFQMFTFPWNEFKKKRSFAESKSCMWNKDVTPSIHRDVARSSILKQTPAVKQELNGLTNCSANPTSHTVIVNWSFQLFQLQNSRNASRHLFRNISTLSASQSEQNWHHFSLTNRRKWAMTSVFNRELIRLRSSMNPIHVSKPHDL